MTTYCLNPNETWLAVYTLNTATMPTNNVVFSDLIADLSASWTSATIKSWEWAMFEVWMIATIEQLNSEWKATAREVILINGITDNVLSITRWYEKCVQDDTATPKALWNTPKAFTTWARISVYVSKALLSGVQTRLQQVNCPCNTSVYNQALAMTNEIDSCCDNWRAKLYDKLSCKCWYSSVFGSWCDGDCVISWEVFLCANKTYEFNNLTINAWARVRFEWQWVPKIRVRNRFINNWIIDTRWWQCTWACSFSEQVTWTTISNLSTNWNPFAWWNGWWSAGDHCYGDPGAWKPWCNGNINWWWAGWDACNCWTDATCGCPADWFNGWTGWNGWWRTYTGWWWGGGWWWWWRFGNGWNWWRWWAYRYDYWYNGWRWWNGWNAGYWWTGWNWWDRCSQWAYNFWWHWWNWYIWWNWTSWWNGGCWVIQWWNGWWAPSICWWSGWKWWDAVNNTFWILLTARILDNSNGKICSKWWNGGNGWNWNWSNCCTWYTNWWQWWNGANGWCVIMIYWNSVKTWTIDVSWWSGWTWWCTYACHCREASGSNGTAWSYKVCKFTY